jgi:hypothetical protein
MDRAGVSVGTSGAVIKRLVDGIQKIIKSKIDGKYYTFSRYN